MVRYFNQRSGTSRKQQAVNQSAGHQTRGNGQSAPGTDSDTIVTKMPPHPRSQIPRTKAVDSTLALVSEGYTFISNRCRALGSDVFETRIMLMKAVCAMGEEAAAVFYQPDRFTRRGAMPLTVLKLLQDKGSVHTLDGEAHRVRKQMFMSLMTPSNLQRLSDIMADEWRTHTVEWEVMDRIVLFSEAQGVLCRAVCFWAGVPLTPAEAIERTREFAAMTDGAGWVGPRNWRGMILRARAERWARSLIAEVRAGRLDVPATSALSVIARHRDWNGAPLDLASAAVELLNVLRPTVAVAHFIMFAALALHEFPEWRQRFQSGDESDLENFVHEVRRFYPLFPAIAGRVLKPFVWRDHRFEKGAWFLLDLYGTNHDPRIWREPDKFRPDRFRGWDGNPFTLIPQGGGDFHTGHRCAGEWITIELVKRAVRLLTTAMRYDVPEQDLRVSLSRVPALPNSRFIITNVAAIQ